MSGFSPARGAARWTLFGLLTCAAVAGGLTLTVSAPTAEAKKKARPPADVLAGRIILATQPFPSRFKTDSEFVRHMKRVDTNTLKYGDAEKIDVEFMAFFRKPQTGTEFTASIYDSTAGQILVKSFPIYPQQRETRILAASARLEKSEFEEERRYLMVVTRGSTNVVLAETRFVIKAPPRGKAKMVPTEVKFTE